MQKHKPNLDTKPLSEFSATVAASIQHVQKTKRPLIITQHGKDSVVLMDVSEYEALIDNLELHKQVLAGMSDVANGNVLSHEEFKAKSIS